MNIAVIAANGRTGKIFVEQALAAGHSVRAGVHKSNKLPAHPNLTLVSCDATDQSSVRQLISGQDAVVSFIGHVSGSAPNVQTDAIRAIIAAMQAEKLDRIVSLTGTGVRFPGDHITLADRILNLGITLIDPSRVGDGRTHVDALKQSSLNWTVLRVLKLQNTKPKPFVLRLAGPTKLYVSRHEVAQAALEVLEKNSFVGQAPILSKISRS